MHPASTTHANVPNEGCSGSAAALPNGGVLPSTAGEEDAHSAGLWSES
jgi:hypothetical protein